MSKAWLTPATIPGECRCTPLVYPDSIEWRAIIEGALLLLANPANWEQHGAVTPEDAAVAGWLIYQSFAQQRGDCGMPVGSIIAYASTTPPEGWMLCVGTSLFIADYPELYDVIGNTFGNAPPKFDLPDLFDRFVKGSTGPDFATVVGANNRTLAVANLPPHTHSVVDVGGGSIYGPGALWGFFSKTYPQSGSTGDGTAFDNRPEALCLCYIIKVK